MCKEFFNEMDLDHDGYITRDELVKLYRKRAGEETALATFKAMDTDNDGKVISTYLRVQYSTAR